MIFNKVICSALYLKLYLTYKYFYHIKCGMFNVTNCRMQADVRANMKMMTVKCTVTVKACWTS